MEPDLVALRASLARTASGRLPGDCGSPAPAGNWSPARGSAGAGPHEQSERLARPKDDPAKPGFSAPLRPPARWTGKGRCPGGSVAVIGGVVAWLRLDGTFWRS
jgi:hypothetical protein